MSMKLKKMHIIGAVFAIIAGVLLHFTYSWSGENAVVGAFSAVNESTWEHLKLIFFPVLLFMLAEYFIYGDKVSGFFTSKLVAVLSGMITIVVLFYTYSGVIGSNNMFVDIAIFVIGVIVNYLLSYKLISEERFTSKTCNILSLAAIVIIAILFVLWTFDPLSLGIFADPKMCACCCKCCK